MFHFRQNLHRILNSFAYRPTRTFIAARVKWVRDPWLDTAVSKEKNLIQITALMNQILNSPSKSLPLSSLSLLKPQFNLHTTVSSFIDDYPLLFTLFQPRPSFPLQVKLTPQALSLQKETAAFHSNAIIKQDTIVRLVKLLMLTNSCKLPLEIVDRFRFDLGLPVNFVSTLLTDYPEFFTICEGFPNGDDLFLELVAPREEFAVSELQRRKRTRFELSYPDGFDLQKRVRNWVEDWQELPYISPYENAFHLNRKGDQAEKWVVAVLHEVMWLLASKKTEKENVMALGDYLGFEDRFRKALIHHPGIFYVSNKNRTHTVVLREAYRKDVLIVKHPLMGTRFRYIYLMNKRRRNYKQHRSVFLNG